MRAGLGVVLVGLVVCVGCGRDPAPAPSPTSVIKALGGRIFTWDTDTRMPTRVSFQYDINRYRVDRKPPVTDADLLHLKRLANSLVHLDLHGTKVTDAGLTHLKGLTKLEELSLINTNVTGAGLVHLKRLTKLKTLKLNDTKVTDAGLVYLKDITKLGEVHLLGTNVTEEGVGELRMSRPGCMVVWFPR